MIKKENYSNQNELNNEDGATTPKKRGRPRLEHTIDPEWYEIILQSGREGKHITDFLITLGVSWESHRALMKRNTKYFEAVQEYQKLCEQWWYNKAHQSMVEDNGASFNSRLWSLIMRNKFGNNWTDSKSVDVTSQGEKIGSVEPIKIEIIKKQSEGDN